MRTGAVAVTPLPGAPFGAAVELRVTPEAIDDGTAAHLRRLLAAHQLLVFSQELSDDEHVLLAGAFGRVLPQGPRVEVNAPAPADPPIITLVSNVEPGGGLGTSELAFHHDMAHVPTPLTGLSLHALSVGDGQTTTRFASGRLAYGHLPLELARRLEGLQALFVGNYTTLSDGAVLARAARDMLDPTWPCAVHPVVVPHPVTGEPCIYVNEMQTTAILGLAQHESDALLDTLFAHLYDAANIYEHKWRGNDLVVWDNLSLQHARRRVGEHSDRTLRRVVFGEKAPWEEWPRARLA